MNKKDILKKTGLSESEFYSLYPTEESYIKAMGGDVTNQFNSPIPDFFNPQFIMKHGGDVPCYDCGGSYMQDGGVSPFGYGQFPAMQTGGIPGFDPSSGSHMLSAGQQSLTPEQLQASGFTLPSGQNQYWNADTGKYYKTYSPGQPGYTAPMSNMQQPITQNQIPPLNTYTPKENTNFDSSMFNPVKQVNTGNVFKSRPTLNHGGSAPQGETEDDVLSKMKNTFTEYLQNNMVNAMHRDAQQEATQQFMKYGGLPMAQDGYAEGKSTDRNKDLEMMLQNYLNQQQRNIPYTASSNQPSYQGMNYFPMNYNKSYGFSKKDASKAKEVIDHGQLQGWDVEYGPLARLMGKTGQKMFGPKSVSYNFKHGLPNEIQTGPQIQLQPDVMTSSQNVSNNQPMSMIPYMDPKDFINHTNNPYQTMQAGGSPWDFQGSQTPDYRQQAFGEQSPFAIGNMQMTGPSSSTLSPDLALNKLNSTSSTITANRKFGVNSEEAVNWGLATSSGIASAFERQQDMQAKRDMEALQTGDRNFATQGDRGKWDPNQGMFDPTQMTPVQFTGQNLSSNSGQLYGMGGYYKLGGSYFEDGGEYELSDEEIAEIEANGGSVEFLD